MKHPDHICRFNDAPQSCDCYDTGYDDAIQSVRERVEAELGHVLPLPEDAEEFMGDFERGTVGGGYYVKKIVFNALKDLEAPVEGDGV